MRPAFLARWALAAALVVAAGCSSNKGKLESTTWASTATTVNGEEIAAGAQRLQFGKDGHLFYTVAGKLYKGNYTLGMGPAVIFTLEEDLEGRKIHPHKIVIQGDQLTLTNADGKEVVFEKVN
jgi:heat shock protein HslJ